MSRAPHIDEGLGVVPELRGAESVSELAGGLTNNDLLAESFIDVGGRFRLIDYEYPGNNDACFELGNIWSESNLSLDQLDELVAHYYGRALGNKVARAGPLGPHVQVRLDALGIHP